MSPVSLSFHMLVIATSIAAFVPTQVRAQTGPGAQNVPSGTGRFIAFASAATDLVPGDTNNSWDVFVRDRQTNIVTRVSVASDGTERIGDSGRTQFVDDTIDISDDGRIVVFASHAPLVANDTNRCEGTVSSGDCKDIYVHDRTTGETTRVSVASDGTQGDNSSSGPSLSPDGRYVSFVSAATTLVADERNAQPDIFLHDRVTHTTTRISASTNGVESFAPSFQASAANSGIVAFITEARLSDEPDSLPCRGTAACKRAYVYVPGEGPKRVLLDGTLSLNEPPLLAANSPQVLSVDIDGSGRWIAVYGFLQRGFNSRLHAAMLYDRLTQRTLLLETTGGVFMPYVGISGNGRMVSAYMEPTQVLFDRVTGMRSQPPACCRFNAARLSADGFTVVSTITGQIDSLDADGDAMADDWETAVGLDPNSAVDAAFDFDGDTLSNLEEYQAGSHPKGTATRYLAEGAANAFFTTDVALFNPANTPTAVVLRFLGAGGTQTSYTTTLAAGGRQSLTLTPVSHIPSSDFSTVIESATPLVVERTMTWDGSGYGAHAETAIDAPATTWYLAEGATHGAFDLFYLLQNPNDEEALVTITYLRPAPRTPVVKTYTVDARSRRTIWVDDEGPELTAEDVAARIESDRPILVERAMYASTPTQPFAAGHDGAGIAAPSLKWFFAEGATGPFFDLYLLVSNPGAGEARVRVSYLRSEGEPIVKTYDVGAEARLTVSVSTEDPRLAQTVASMLVESINGQPIVAERAMWWPRGQWYEAHLSAGATATGTRWGLAEVIVNDATETYILIANTGTVPGTARVMTAACCAAVEVELPAQSRVTVRPAAIPSIGRGIFSVIVDTDVPTVVERTTYTTVNGVMWAAGTSVLATRLRE